MSRQLDYYYRNKDAILAKRKNKYVKTNVKTNSVKTSDGILLGNYIKPSEPKLKPVRIHAIGLLWNSAGRIDLDALPATSFIAITDWEAGSGFKKLEYKGFKARLTPLSLSLWLPKPIDVGIGCVQAEETEAITSLYAIRDFMAVRLNLCLQDEAEILQEHIAFVGDPGARQAVEQKHTIKVLDKKDALARFVVDVSTGVPEAEFVHRRHAFTDTKLYEEMVVDVTQNAGYRLLQARLEASEQRAERMETLMLGYGEQLVRHIPVLELAEKLLHTHPSKRVRQAVEDLNQRKLIA